MSLAMLLHSSCCACDQGLATQELCRVLLEAASQRASHVTGGTHVAAKCAQRVSPDNSASTKKENGTAWLLRGEHSMRHTLLPRLPSISLRNASSSSSSSSSSAAASGGGAIGFAAVDDVEACALIADGVGADCVVTLDDALSTAAGSTPGATGAAIIAASACPPVNCASTLSTGALRPLTVIAATNAAVSAAYAAAACWHRSAGMSSSSWSGMSANESANASKSSASSVAASPSSSSDVGPPHHWLASSCQSGSKAPLQLRRPKKVPDAVHTSRMGIKIGA
jgi:hypothetical protein